MAFRTLHLRSRRAQPPGMRFVAHEALYAGDLHMDLVPPAAGDPLVALYAFVRAGLHLHVGIVAFRAGELHRGILRHIDLGGLLDGLLRDEGVPHIDRALLDQLLPILIGTMAVQALLPLRL